MEQYFATFFEDVRHEQSLILFLSLVEPDILKQSNSTDYENDNIKKYCSIGIVSSTSCERKIC